MLKPEPKAISVKKTASDLPKIIFVEALRLKYPKFDNTHNIVLKAKRPDSNENFYMHYEQASRKYPF